MNMIEEIYRELKLEHLNLTEAEFSKDYLGRSDTYFAYLKSAEKQASAAALLNLLKRLRTDKVVCERQLQKQSSDYSNRLMLNWIGLYERLGDKIQIELLR